MSILIHNKEYVTVSERVLMLHDAIRNDGAYKDKRITFRSEFLENTSQIVCHATVEIGDDVFEATSAANPDKAIEKMSPYEVAETSAYGRCLGFAGFGIVEGIATADEMVKAGATQPRVSDPRVPDEIKNTVYATDKQVTAINQMIKAGQLKPEIAKEIPSMTASRASQLISSVWGGK